jgi:membrane protein implicated in regulation of membrane protease activity
MFIPFLAASILAAAFTKMGAMSVQIAMLTSALNTLLFLVIAAAVYMVWHRRKA